MRLKFICCIHECRNRNSCIAVSDTQIVRKCIYARQGIVRSALSAGNMFCDSDCCTPQSRAMRKRTVSHEPSEQECISSQAVQSTSWVKNFDQGTANRGLHEFDVVNILLRWHYRRKLWFRFPKGHEAWLTINIYSAFTWKSYKYAGESHDERIG